MSDPAARAAERIYHTPGLLSQKWGDAIKRGMAGIIRAEYAELMPCGHRKACWQEGVPHAGNPAVLWKPHCTACEREAAAVQARDRQWCSELAKHDVAASAMYPGGIEIEVPTIAEAVQAAREECAQATCCWCRGKYDENRIPRLRVIAGQNVFWHGTDTGGVRCQATAIRSVNLTGALDRLIAGAYLAAARIPLGQSTRTQLVGLISMCEIMRKEILALTPADAQRALDRKVNEGRLEEACWWWEFLDEEHLEDTRTKGRIAALKAALEKPLTP